MPTTAYLNASVALDNSGATPVLRVIDTSVYPTGTTVVTGTITVQQPDGISVVIGDALSLGHQATPYQTTLRLASDGSFQNGVYTVTFNITNVVTTSPDPIPNLLQKSFTLDYSKPVAVLTPAINAFLPSIKVNDNTGYAQTGLSLVSTSRTWNAQISGVGNVPQSVTPVFDVANSGNYYDALYNVTGVFIVQYSVVAANWVSVIDKINGAAIFDVYPVIDLSTLLGHINTYKAALYASNAAACEPCACDDAFAKIWSLFGNFKESGLCSYWKNQYMIYNELISLLGITNTTHTYGVLAKYNFNNYCGYANGVPVLTKLATPVLSIQSFTSSGVTVSGSAVANAEKYITDWSTDPAFGTITGSTTIFAPTVAFLASVLNPDTIYYFRRKATAAGFLDSDYGYINQRTAAVITPGIIYFGYREGQDRMTEAEILAGDPMTFTEGATSVVIDMRTLAISPVVYWFAQRVPEGVKTKWVENMSTGNFGIIDSADLWYLRGSLPSTSGADWRFYYTTSETLFDASQNPITFSDF